MCTRLQVNKWLLVNLTDKNSDGWIRDLGFNPQSPLTHEKLISVLVWYLSLKVYIIGWNSLSKKKKKKKNYKWINYWQKYRYTYHNMNFYLFTTTIVCDAQFDKDSYVS